VNAAQGRFLLVYLGAAFSACFGPIADAQECAPLTNQAPLAFTVEFAHKAYGKACEQRFPEFRDQILTLYPEWKSAAAKHLEIAQCHYERREAERTVEAREAIRASDEADQKKTLEEILNGSEQRARSHCDWQLRWLKYRTD
jgi:hypothetical protein